MLHNQTIAAVATPPGEGGLAVIRVSGPQAVQIVGKIFYPFNPDKSLERANGYTAMLGNIREGERQVDQCVALLFRTPHSYTGEDVVELSCHGGEAVSREVLHACYRAGAQPAQPGEFTKRALLNGKLSLTQAEAVMDLISAHSRQGVAAAQVVLEGGLYRTIARQKEKLVQLAGHLAAYVDYPEEDVEELQVEDFVQTVESVLQELKWLIDGYERGLLLKRGVRAVIAGSPNVGKSTLFNLLSGFERTIVTPVAGTTRDVVREEIIVGGVPLHLADTAGLHETEDTIEAEGIRRSYEELEQAGLIIAVFDGSLPLGAKEWELAERCAGHSALAVVNKSDLGLVFEPDQLRKCFDHLVVTSAKTLDSAAKIEQAVAKILHMEQLNTDTVLLANERQLSAAVQARGSLEQAVAALQQGFTLDAAGVCLEDALRFLSDLTGENASDAVIEDVFSRFCVGK